MCAKRWGHSGKSVSLGNEIRKGVYKFKNELAVYQPGRSNCSPLLQLCPGSIQYSIVLMSSSSSYQRPKAWDVHYPLKLTRILWIPTLLQGRAFLAGWLISGEQEVLCIKHTPAADPSQNKCWISLWMNQRRCFSRQDFGWCCCWLGHMVPQWDTKNRTTAQKSLRYQVSPFHLSRTCVSGYVDALMELFRIFTSLRSMNLLKQ